MNYYENRKIMGGWAINRLIGVGSYGRVYEISQNGGEFRAALKIISIPENDEEYQSACENLGSEESAREYFSQIKDNLINEIKFLYRLQGFTNIVNYHNHEIVPHDQEYGWDILIQMELLDSLSSYYGKKRKITMQDVIRLGMDICKALERCQKFNIVHRDIKPDNIMVSDTGDYKLGDFGVSCILRNDRTRRMSRKGTEYYMAPELLYPGRKSDSRVDIYSLGIVMYKLLNANRYPLLPPYPQKYDLIADENEAFIRRVKGARLPFPQYAENTRLGEIVLKACEADPNKRYFSPHDMYEDLAAIQMDEKEEIIFQMVSDARGVTYRPTPPRPRTVDITIKGKRIRARYDGQEKMVSGFYSDARQKNVQVLMAPGVKAEARGTKPGMYPMGLSQRSFILKPSDPRLQIGTFTVLDGGLLIEKKKGNFQQQKPKKETKKWPIIAASAILLLIPILIFTLSGKKENHRSEEIYAEQAGSEYQAVTQGAGTMISADDSADAEVQEEMPVVAPENLNLQRIGVFQRFELKEIGKTDEKFFDDYHGNDDGLYKIGKNGYTLSDALGNVVFDEEFNSVDKIREDLYAVTLTGKGVQQTGLIRADGTVIIPCKYFSIRNISERFLLVSVAEEECDNPRQANMHRRKDSEYSAYGRPNMDYTQPGNPYMDGHISESDTLYTGYHKIYDLKTGSFVPDIKVESGGECVRGYANTICVLNGKGIYTFYNAEGEAIKALSDIHPVFNRNSVKFTSGFSGIYGDKLQLLYKTDNSLDMVRCTMSSDESAKGDLYCEKNYEDMNQSRLINAYGDQMTPIDFEHIVEVNGSYITAEKNGNYGLVSMDGDMIYNYESPENLYGWELDSWNLGFYTGGKGSGDKQLLIGLDGTKQYVPDTFLKLVDYRENGTEYDVYCIRKEDYVLKSSELPDRLTAGVVVLHDPDGFGYGLYDTVNGIQLLPDEYDDIRYANDYIYAMKTTPSGKKCVVYQLERIYQK